MAKCYFERLTNRGNAVWGNWICAGINIEDRIIKFCRKAFKGKYANYWIDPVYFDDKYFRHTNSFFSEVGVMLYPKKTRLPRKNKENDGFYNRIVYDTAMKDISDKDSVEPIRVIVKGIRYKDEHHKSTYIEKITSIKEVPELEGMTYNY